MSKAYRHQALLQKLATLTHSYSKAWLEGNAMLQKKYALDIAKCEERLNTLKPKCQGFIFSEAGTCDQCGMKH